MEPTDRGAPGLRVDSFAPVVLADRARFLQIRLDDLSPHVLNFANLVIWQRKYRFRWGLAGDRIAVHNPTRGFLYIDDVLGVPPSTLAGWFDKYSLVPAHYPRHHPDTGDFFAVATYPREQQDYIYELAHLARLDEVAPPRYRTYLHRFVRRHPDARVHPLTPDDRGACDRLYQRWLGSKRSGPVGVDRPEFEYSAFVAAWDAFEPLHLEGLGLFVGDALAAFLLYDQLTPRTMLCHFLKSDYTVHSSGTALLWLAARELQGRFDYFNFEQDLGLPGLRRYKQALGPYAVTDFLQLIRR